MEYKVINYVNETAKSKDMKKELIVEALTEEGARERVEKLFPKMEIIEIKGSEEVANAKDELQTLNNNGVENVMVFNSNYAADKNDRVRIPVHERKKIFRYTYPMGAILATTPGLNRELKEARGHCEIKIDRNDLHAVVTADAFCSASELKSQGFPEHQYPEVAETQSITRAMTNLAIPQFLDEVDEIKILKKLDQTNELVKKYMKQFDKSIVSGSIKINEKFQINISSDIRKVTGFEKGDHVNVSSINDELVITKSIGSGEKKIQSNYRLLLGKNIIDHGFRIGTFDFEMKEGELCLVKKHK